MMPPTTPGQTRFIVVVVLVVIALLWVATSSMRHQTPCQLNSGMGARCAQQK